MCANIAVDIDDSLYSFTDEAREVLSLMIDEPQYEPYHERLTHALYAKWDQWRTPFELCGVDDDGESLWLECVVRCHDDEVILRQTPFTGSREVCQELADAGHQLVYISNRATETYGATLRWLTDSGFPVDGPHKLVVTAGNKAEHIRHCQYMIDDRVKNVIEFVYDYDWKSHSNTVGKRKAFVRVADYNGELTDVEGLYLAHTWAGLRRYMVKTELLPERVSVNG